MKLRTAISTNLLLEAFEEPDRKLILAKLETVQLEQGAVLLDAGEPFRKVLFPSDAVISMVCQFADGTVVETVSIGREGAVGLGGPIDRAINRHVVQLAGTALAVDYSAFRRAMDRSATLRRVCLEYLQAFQAQVLQSVACNGLHSLEERYARWLLTTHDRVPGDTFPLTQESLASMLGVHRPSVSLAARKLQNAGLISYNRGEITLLDRTGLEKVSCECYRIICDHYERHLPRAFCHPAVAVR